MTRMKERVDSEAKFKIKDKGEKCLELSQTDTFSDPQTVKNQPAMQETWMGLIPGLERSPGEGNGTHSNILAWRDPGTE